MQKVLIIGATSAIAQAVARHYAAAGDALYLAGRDEEKLAAVAADLQVRGAASVQVGSFDALAEDGAEALVQGAVKALVGLDVVLIAHGTLPDQAACAGSVAATREALQVNALSVMVLLTELGNVFERQGAGTIAVISSVAGDRGRQSNYVYGAAKGAVSVFLQGLRNRLHAKGVRVITIKPGFVNTPMTAAFDKGLLWAQPEQVAGDIVRAIEKGRDVVYTPWFWRYIMWVIKLIPEFVFKRLGL